MKKADTRRHASEARKSESLSAEIRNLARQQALLKGIRIDVRNISARRVKNHQIVTVDFVTPQEITETVDERTGVIRASSDGAQYTYTFTNAIPLEENLAAFREFYEKRSRAAGKTRAGAADQKLVESLAATAAI
jgi:hypothetical protein